MATLKALKETLLQTPGVHRLMTELLQQLPPCASLYVVGGTVRDVLCNNLVIKDLDFMIAGSREVEVQQTLKTLRQSKALRAFQKVGQSFPVFKLWLFETSEPLDIALARTETSVGTGHRDFTVEANAISAREDAARRDFTVNALMARLELADGNIECELEDFFGGFLDLQARRLRAVGNAQERFEEDPLRMLRALRFHHQKGLQPDEEIQSAIQKSSPALLPTVSADRIQDEILKAILASPRGMLLDLKRYRLHHSCLEPLSFLNTTVPDWIQNTALPSRELATCFLFVPWLVELNFPLQPKPGFRSLEQSLIQLHFPNPRLVRTILNDCMQLIHLNESRTPLALSEKIQNSHAASSTLFLYNALRPAHGQNLLQLPDNAPPRIHGKTLMQWGEQPGPGFEGLVLLVREWQLAGLTETEIRQKLASTPRHGSRA